MSEKKYRYEHKFIISNFDAAVLKNQLALVCKLDKHSVSKDYSYDIRSLYFDDVLSSGYNDKVNGEQYRKKYRIRIYNGSSDIIKLECKHKDNDMTYKEDASIDLETCKKLVNGEFNKIKSKNKLVLQFLLDSKLFGLRPSVIVDYRRLAFTYPVSDVRITFDEHIRSGRYAKDLFSDDFVSQELSNSNYVELEVKCNDFIPSHILSVLNSVDKVRLAISKYALCYEVK